MQYCKTEDKREDYSTPGKVEKSLLYFIYYIYNSLYNYSRIYRSYLLIYNNNGNSTSKGLSGMLGPFYNNSKGARKGEESKQPIKPQSFCQIICIL